MAKKIAKDWELAFSQQKPAWLDTPYKDVGFTGYKFRKLVRQYDIIVGYGGSAILPYVAGSKCFIAFEHGTIRELPESEKESDMLLMLSYAQK